MIEYRTGDVLASGAEALVNTVNCVGIMGRGVALQFKKAFPANFKAYEIACKRGEVQPGRLFVYETGRLDNPRLIINFPTKRHWRGKSRIEDIELGLDALANELRRRNVTSIAIPPLGSGLGGLNWASVRSRIEASLREFSHIDIIVYEPGGGPTDSRPNESSDVPKMTSGRAALVTLMDRYLAGLLNPFVTLLEVHKLMYFLQASGEPLRLRYTKGLYGPYAENLRHVLSSVEGHLVAGYADGGDAPDKQLQLVPGAVADARAYLQDNNGTLALTDRVSDLVEGFESPFGLELLATVHWVAAREQPRSVEEVQALTYAWNTRKKQFTPRQIALAVDVLTRKGWIDDLSSRTT